MGNRVTITIETSPETIVGEWKMTASVSYRKEETNRPRTRKETQLYILFNPWDRGNTVCNSLTIYTLKVNHINPYY